MKEGKKELNNNIAIDGDDKEKENLEQKKAQKEEQREEQKEEQRKEQKGKQEADQKFDKEIEGLKKQLAEMSEKNEEYLGMLQRTVAEFDNYKKRTQKEKELIRKETICDVIADFLKVADNLERALASTEKECDYKNVREGIELVYRQFNEILQDIGVEEIKCVGGKFDPNLHNAVMHVSDEAYGDNEVVEEFQKGYIIGDRVIRHSVVKVAN